MKIKAKASSNVQKQESMEAGTYPARTAQILYLGTQEQRPFQGQPKPDAPEMMVTYEFVDEFCVDEDGNALEDKPRWLSETFPLHSRKVDRARSAKRYNALDPKGEHVESDGEGDWSLVIDVPCMVTVTATPGKGQNADRVFNNIANVAPMRAKEAAKCPELVNPSKVFSAEEPDMEILGSLPEWLQDKIKGSPEFKESQGEAPAVKEEPADDAEEEDNGEW